MIKKKISFECNAMFLEGRKRGCTPRANTVNCWKSNCYSELLFIGCTQFKQTDRQATLRIIRSRRTRFLEQIYVESRAIICSKASRRVHVQLIQKFKIPTWCKWQIPSFNWQHRWQIHGWCEHTHLQNFATRVRGCGKTVVEGIKREKIKCSKSINLYIKRKLSLVPNNN